MVELFDLLLEQSRKDLDLRVKIIEEETKKSGFILAAIGVLLGVLLNTFLITQQITAVNSTSQNSSGISPLDLGIIRDFFNFQLVFAEAALLLLSAICLVTVLTIFIFRTEKLPIIDYTEWMKGSKSNDNVKDLQESAINNTKHSIEFLDEKIERADFYYLLGILSFLGALVLLVFIIIFILIGSSALENFLKAVVFTVIASIGAIITFIFLRLIIRTTIAEAESPPAKGARDGQS